jgi:hypothetical protein
MREYVDIKGLIELRTVYDDPSYRDPENEEDDVDMLDFQEEWDCIPENFCAKDRDYGCQRIFFCLACDCDMKSLISLESHVGGSKHAKKAIELKRLKSGMAPIEPLEKKAKLLKPVVRADVSRTLVDRLKENPAFPALGTYDFIFFASSLVRNIFCHFRLGTRHRVYQPYPPPRYQTVQLCPRRLQERMGRL